MPLPERFAYDGWLPEPLRTELRQWFKFHGIDTNYVCVPGYVERDAEKYAVRVWSYVPDPVSKFKRTNSGSPVMILAEYRNEGPPLPFPDAVYKVMR